MEQNVHRLVTMCIEAEATLYRSVKKRKDALQRYMANAVAYAKSECRDLCKKMYNRLPRELRDMVYSHILKNNVIWVGQPQLKTSTEARFAAQRAHRFMGLNDPSVEPEPTKLYIDPTRHVHRHIFDMEFVTYPILLELDESWYGETTFYLDDPSHIPNFLARSPLSSELDVSDLVRKIRIILPENVVRKNGYEIKRHRRNHRNYVRIITTSDRCDNYPPLLASFLASNLKPSTAITFHIVPTIDVDRHSQVTLRRIEVWDKHERSVRVLLDGMAYIWPLIEELEKRGRKITVCLDSAAQLFMSKNDTVWNPEGCLARAIEWGVELRNKATQTIS